MMLLLDAASYYPILALELSMGIGRFPYSIPRYLLADLFGSAYHNFTWLLLA
jgi:hypothetical protein